MSSSYAIQKEHSWCELHGKCTCELSWGLGAQHSEEDISNRFFKAFRYEIPVIREHIPALSSILDFGCGSGELARVLMDNGYDVTGYDVQPDSVRVARERFGVNATVGLETLGIFDAVLCIQTLQYIEDKVGAVKSMLSHLKPGGLLLIEQSNPLSIFTRLARVPANELYEVPEQPGMELVDIVPGKGYRRATDTPLQAFLKNGCQWLAHFLHQHPHEIRIYTYLPDDAS